MADKDEILNRFVELTNTDATKARFFLGMSDWQLEPALTRFYDEENPDDVEIEEVPISEPSETAKEETTAGGSTTSGKDKKPAPAKGPSSGIATLASYTQEDDDSDEEGQAFYAGGSEHSGQQVLGPSKKKDFVSEMFKQVREAGAEVVDPRQRTNVSGPRVFTGTGYRLGQTPTESTTIPSTSEGAPDQPASIILKMWKTGFSIDGGPLREYADPENLPFLRSIRNGEIPSELIQQARGREVHLDMEDHRHTDFELPKHFVKAFTGKGHVLGSPAPATIGMTATATATASGTEQDRAVNEEQARNVIEIDSTQPTTTVQVRLADGSRLAATLNHTHTVADLRRFIITARPEYQQRSFHLRTTFPSAELTDETKTIKDANLLNAAVLQRLT